MKKYALTLSLITLISSGCHRPETITSVYSVPSLDTEQKAATLKNTLKTELPDELQEVNTDISSHTVTATFDEQSCRTMNVEMAIAKAGFSVNHRPGYATHQNN